MIEASQQVPAIFEPGPQEIENDWWPPGGKTVYCINKHDLGPSLLELVFYRLCIYISLIKMQYNFELGQLGNA